MANFNQNKLVSILGICFTIVVMVIVFGSMELTKRTEPAITVDSQNLTVKGMFGIEQPLSGIKEISLKEEAPVVIKKTNGSAISDICRGSFDIAELGVGKLFVHLNQKPFIYIITDESYVIINFKDSNKTKELYDKLMSEWGANAVKN